MPSSFFINNGLTIFSFIYLILILIMFFLKNNTKNIKRKIYFIILVFILVTICLYFAMLSIAKFNLSIATNIGRALAFILFIWIFLIILYLSIAFNSEEENKVYFEKKRITILVILSLYVVITGIFCITGSFDVIVFNSKNLYYFTGSLSYLYKYFSLTVLFVNIFQILRFRKKMEIKNIIFFLVSLALCLIPLAISFVFKEPINDIIYIQIVFAMFLFLSVEDQDKLLLEEYNESSRKVKELNNLKREFIDNISYQLKSLMNTIIGHSDSILKDNNITSSKITNDFSFITKSSYELFELINAIVDISKVEDDNDEIESGNYKLDTIIFDINSKASIKLKNKDITFTINVNENCPNELYGDYLKLNKIINNIISNAIKYTIQGEINFDIKYFIEKEDCNFIFTIKHPGHEMSVDEFNKSFDDLVKEASENKNAIDSNSLNIIVAKKLIEKFGGTIEFINKIGMGTQYIIKIKQKINGEETIGNIKEKIINRYTVINTKHDYTGKKALIINDTNSTNVVLEKLLNEYNISVDKKSKLVKNVLNNDYDVIFIKNSLLDDYFKSNDYETNKNVPVISLFSRNNSNKKNNKCYSNLNCPINNDKLKILINKLFSDK